NDWYMVVVVVLFLFFRSYVYHHFLHSFPTRRSSDLLGDDRDFFAIIDRSTQVTDLVPGLDRQRGAGQTFTDRHGGVSPGGPGFEDRKSTRLNSSHVKISYAVFCLKKKKFTQLSEYVC